MAIAAIGTRSPQQAIELGCFIEDMPGGKVINVTFDIKAQEWLVFFRYPGTDRRSTSFDRILAKWKKHLEEPEGA
jgi:hypothetical protein